MAKTKGLIIVFFLLVPWPAFAESGALQAPLTVTVQETPLSMTQTTEYYEDILNLKINELHLNITPYFKVVLPDASVNLGLKQRIGDTTLEGMTEYNYIYNKIKYFLKYGLETYFPVYVSLYDNLEFEQIYKEQKYIQRTKGLGLSIGTPIVFSVLKFGEEFKNENAYLALLDNTLTAQEGLASIFNTWMQLKIMGKTDAAEFELLRLDINFDKAIPHKYSAYNFLFLNCSLSTNIKFDKGNNLLLNIETGHMLEAQNVPLWKIYSLGGYDRLIGYSLNKFQDYYKIFGRIRYDGTIMENTGWELWWFKLDSLKGFFIADCGRTGDVHQIQILNTYKYGLGAGISMQFTFRKRTLVLVTLAIGQAMEKHIPPVVYFIYELL